VDATDAVPQTRDELLALLRRAKAGDETTLPVVRRMLAAPEHIRTFGGDLTRAVEAAFVADLSRQDVGLREAVLRQLEVLRAELSGPNPSPLERMLVDRVVACWLAAHDAELRYTVNAKDMTFRNGDYQQRRMDATSRRYLAAIKALATVRKLALPLLRVNIAGAVPAARVTRE
jgi:hypothetical protein